MRASGAARLCLRLCRRLVVRGCPYPWLPALRAEDAACQRGQRSSGLKGGISGFPLFFPSSAFCRAALVPGPRSSPFCLFGNTDFVGFFVFVFYFKEQVSGALAPLLFCPVLLWSSSTPSLRRKERMEAIPHVLEPGDS